MNDFVFSSFKRIKRIIIGIIGFTILLVGLLMVVLPGPAIVFIPIGLSILGTEYLWAKKLLKRIKNKFTESNSKIDPK